MEQTIIEAMKAKRTELLSKVQQLDQALAILAEEGAKQPTSPTQPVRSDRAISRKMVCRTLASLEPCNKDRIARSLRWHPSEVGATLSNMRYQGYADHNEITDEWTLSEKGRAMEQWFVANPRSQTYRPKAGERQLQLA